MSVSVFVMRDPLRIRRGDKRDPRAETRGILWVLCSWYYQPEHYSESSKEHAKPSYPECVTSATINLHLHLCLDDASALLTMSSSRNVDRLRIPQGGARRT